VKADRETLDAVFGPGSGDTPATRARESRRLFVRGLDLLTFDHSPKAKGHRLSAVEALEAYGFDRLAEVASEGSAVISESIDAAGRVLRERRECLGIAVRAVARRTGLTNDQVQALESSKRRPVREYEQVARVLGLDERMLSFRGNATTNERLAVRLRTMRDEGAGLSSATVGVLAEAAWVTSVQARLEKDLGLRQSAYSFEPEEFFGSYQTPPYRIGYELAERVRSTLGLGDLPIQSLRELAEKKLGIIVLHAHLAQEIAGATVESGDGTRAIVLNLAGRNENVYVARSTLAHELCHFLFDPRSELRELRVDDYAELERRPDQVADRVEARANAFAVQLLAPQRAALQVYDASAQDGLAEVLDRFGISFTAGRYQVWNAKHRTVEFASISTTKTRPEPSWEVSERYTTTWHPVRELLGYPLRAGRFSAVVVRALDCNIVSLDTAASYLCTTEAALSVAAPQIRECYPDVFT
jgi:Zn-dependent peptidase ImmA (M78 family)